MKNHANSLLREASQEELAACIRLLALSVVQHRETCSFVSFREAAEHLRPRGDHPKKAELIVAGRDAVEEAMELVRTIAADVPPPVEQEPDSATMEKRKQMRINITAPIQLIWPGDDTPTDARLQNISWGGAAIGVDKIKMDHGDTLQILLPGTKGSQINIEARILRTWKLSEEDGEGFAVRFSSLAASDESELEEVLKVLAESADCGGLRQHARLTQRLDLQFDGDELHATLEDISAGGLGITVLEPLQIGQSLQAVVSAFDENYSLKLRARVVRQEPVQMGRTQLYHAGLKFEHPSEELTRLTRNLVDEMLKDARATD